MIDLARLRKVNLTKTPWGQLVTANFAMAPDYHFPRKTDIVLEGVENLPEDLGVIFAMNHTDRYYPWPFQYQLYRRKLGFTVTWVKAKYFENWFVGPFMRFCNNIPLPSRGYVISAEFRKVAQRPPSNEEYRALRDLMDGKRDAALGLMDEDTDDVRRFLTLDGQSVEERMTGLEAMFEEMMALVANLSTQVLEDLDSHLLVCPQGTRSKRLIQGKTGMIQMAQNMGAVIVPVGCNGSDRLYPGASPFSKGGRVVYRIGEPLPVDSGPLAPYRVPPEVIPFSRAAGTLYGEQYRAMTDIVMGRINDLLDPEYQYGEEDNPLRSGVARFV